MEYRDDLADILLKGLPDDERKQVIETIVSVDAEKLRRKRATADDENVVDLSEPDDEDDDLPVKRVVPEQC